MFGYIKKSEVIKMIEKGQMQLREKEENLLLNYRPRTEEQIRDWNESINKLKGGVYFLECLKSKILNGR